MNTVLTFFENNQERLDLKRYGISGQMASVILTPRFHASSHVVFLVFAKENSDPVLVAKIPRRADSRMNLEREAANLMAVQSLRPGGFDSIPRVVAFEEYCGYPILVETALIGRTMTPATVRRRLGPCCEIVTSWLIDLQSAEDGDSTGITSTSFDQLVETPLGYMDKFFPLSNEEKQVLAKTQELVTPLRKKNLSLVFEHGDLANPNVLLLKNGGLGVLDWELAMPSGLPLSDLFFFLSFAAFANDSAREKNEYLTAFQNAFFGRDAWAQLYVGEYARRQDLTPDLMTPLFILTWLRYVVSLLTRLDSSKQREGLHDAETVQWLRANRYFALWQYAVNHADALAWNRVQR